MAEEEGKNPMEWPKEANEASDFDFMMVGKDSSPIMKIKKQKLNEIIVVQGESMPAVQGGTTTATAVALTAGPTGQNRWFDASWGYWKYNNVVLKNPLGTDGIPQGNEGTLYWNGTTQNWSISKFQALLEAKADGVIEPGNTKAISGNDVYLSVNKVEKTVDAIGENFGKSEELTLVNTTVNPIYLSTAAGFYGFGSPIGKLKNFNRLQVNIPTRAIAPTTVTLVLRVGGKTGNILVNVTRSNLSLVALTDNFLNFDFSFIENSGEDQLYLQIYADQNFHEYGATEELLYPTPEYTLSCWRNVNGAWIDDVTHRNLWVRAYYVVEKKVPSDTFFDNFQTKSNKFKDLVRNDAANTSDIVILKDYIINETVTDAFKPSSSEIDGGAMNNPYAIGLLVKDNNIKFNEIELRVSGIDNYQTLVLNVYRFVSIPTGSNILMGSSIYRQEFTGGAIDMSDKITIKFGETIAAEGKYIMIVFTNKLDGYRVQMLRKTGAPVDGDYTLSYINTNKNDTLNTPFSKQGDSYRFNSPILRLNNLKPKDIVSSLESLPPEIISLNNSLLMDAKTDSSNKSYFGVEFRIDENIHINGGDKDVLIFTNGNNSLRLYVTTALATQLEYNQYLLNGGAIPSDRPQWNFLSKYPLPAYNAQFKMEVKIGSTSTTYNFPKRNLRDWKPIVGPDALMIQYKPTIIRNGGLVAQNQGVYEANKNWYIDVKSDSIVIRNSDLGKTKTYYFVDFPYIGRLIEGLIADTIAGGYLEDFIVEGINTGNISSSDTPTKFTRPSTDLLQCSIKLVDLYPYTGYESNANRTAYDSWKCFIPYAIDDSWHSFELITKKDSNELFFSLDGKPASTTGYIGNGRLAIANSRLKMGGGLAVKFKDLEYYDGHASGYDAYRLNNENALSFIASRKNPRVLGIMWHDIIDSPVIGRPTTWMDVPKNIRNNFESQKNSTHSGAAIILYRKYGEFAEDPVLISGNRYKVKCKTGEVLAGVATMDSNNVVTEIKVDELVSGVWSTAPAGLQLYQGLVNRVGNDVLITTAFLEQCFQQCREKGYKIITWQEALDVLNGKRRDSVKYFAPQFDDWALYMYTNNNIRRLFCKYNAKISVALELNNVANPDGTPKEPQRSIAQAMQRNGHENVLHQHFHPNKPLEFISGILSDEAERAIIEAIYKAGESGVTMHIHDQSANQSTPASMKLMEYLGIELSISTQNKSTTRATHRMYASRSGLYPRYATFGSVIE